ncbi:Hpt domain-containing protein [Mesorhizobium sp. B1-1-5]|uniref:Hpt domain-containing protein n=1 Tax=Mesorhizobium sp. B1-1-5 TaxID=2589979 RepID=UPI001FEE18AF|nr:Hpt domain-containing protein [Mesorhizobium sp. B1-1-5]
MLRKAHIGSEAIRPIKVCPPTKATCGQRPARHSTASRFLLEYPLHHPGASPISTDPIAPLRQRFLTRCADQLAELKAIALQATPLPGNDPLIRLAHSLAGAAGTFGFAEISARASVLETLLIEQADGGGSRGARWFDRGHRANAGVTWR